MLRPHTIALLIAPATQIKKPICAYLIAKAMRLRLPTIARRIVLHNLEIKTRLAQCIVKNKTD
jgi:hypothetical protein